jgi:hypothetical protein
MNSMTVIASVDNEKITADPNFEGRQRSWHPWSDVGSLQMKDNE